MKTGWIRTPLSKVAAVSNHGAARRPETIPRWKRMVKSHFIRSAMEQHSGQWIREMIYENNAITDRASCDAGSVHISNWNAAIFPKIGGAIATNKKRLITRDCCVDNNVMGVAPGALQERLDSEFLFYFFLARRPLTTLKAKRTPSEESRSFGVSEGWPLTTSRRRSQNSSGIVDRS